MTLACMIIYSDFAFLFYHNTYCNKVSEKDFVKKIHRQAQPSKIPGFAKNDCFVFLGQKDKPTIVISDP